ncbi:MAG: DNA repair protein RecO [Alcanivoracaceae bacterium]|nr:DNA repair protein RecO [Alcanivoracaceae bacterium]
MSFYKETVGYIIHQRNFKDTSLIIEFFSQEQGMIHLIAKGVKKNKKLKSQIQPFCLLKVQYFGRSQLKTISQINILKNHQQNGLIEKTAGQYLNELIHYSLTENDNAEPLFACYENILTKLGQYKLTPLLRLFEKELLKYSGFELNVDAFTEPDNWLTIDEQLGLIETNIDSQKICKVSDLKLFLDGDTLDFVSQKRLNKIMLRTIDMSLSYRRVYARELLRSIMTK